MRLSAALPAHEWIVYRLSLLLRSVGHRGKTHRITPAAGNERGDIEIQDYVILSHGEDDRLPPRTLVMDVTMTHDRYGRTTQHTNGALTHRVSSTGAPHPDGTLNKATRMKIRHDRQIHVDSPDPIVFLTISVSTSGHVYEDESCEEAHEEIVEARVGWVGNDTDPCLTTRASRIFLNRDQW
jgi:hypothetical protein